jgi:hypothetical protein
VIGRNGDKDSKESSNDEKENCCEMNSGVCGNHGNEKADEFAKKGTTDSYKLTTLVFDDINGERKMVLQH